jgi:amino acid adenylation domain-containing protein
MDVTTDRIAKFPPEQQAIRDRCFHPSGTFVEFPIEDVEQSIPQRFEKIVRMYPDRLAVKDKDRSLTYDELNKAADRIARAILEKRGPGSEPVALLFEHGIDVVAAIFGVLKAGKFYVALDPSLPQERMGCVLSDAEPGIIVTNNQNSDLARRSNQKLSGLLNIDETATLLSADTSGPAVTADDRAAIVYTSGSTGVPKGVVHSHRKMLQGTLTTNGAVQISSDDRLSFIQSVSFGASDSQLYGALLNGAALLPFDIKSQGTHRLAYWLDDERITVYKSAPAVFRQLAELLSGPDKLPWLRLLHLTGAPITLEDFQLYREKISSRTWLVLSMGATEVRGICCAVVNQTFSFPSEGVPVGYPYRGSKVLILGEKGQEVGQDEVGEITVKGRDLGLGYWRRADLTNAKFLPDPSGGDERIYRTGDLGRMLSDGFLIHLGRKDLQVKIRGYRVELTEIERALLSHPLLKDAGVLAWDREPGEKYVAAYIVARHTSRPTVDELRAFLKEKLPSYMIPSAFVFLASLPLTNGKLDRQALPKPGNSRPTLSQAYESPQNELERQLVLIWEEVLGIKPVGIHDNFLDLGGHSLAASRIISRIIKTCELDLPIKALFDSPRVAEMAEVIRQNRSNKASEKDLERLLSELEAMSETEAERLVLITAKGDSADGNQ